MCVRAYKRLRARCVQVLLHYYTTTYLCFIYCAFTVLCSMKYSSFKRSHHTTNHPLTMFRCIIMFELLGLSYVQTVQHSHYCYYTNRQIMYWELTDSVIFPQGWCSSCHKDAIFWGGGEIKLFCRRNIFELWDCSVPNNKTINIFIYDKKIENGTKIKQCKHNRKYWNQKSSLA